MRVLISTVTCLVVALSVVAEPLRYRFEPGTETTYVAKLKGEGELLMGEKSPVAAEGQVEFKQRCEAADGDGLRMQLKLPSATVDMKLLGTENAVPLREADVQYRLDPRGRLSALEGIQQISLMGVGGPLDVGALLLAVVATEFPEGDLTPGATWESRLTLTAGTVSVPVVRRYRLAAAGEPAPPAGAAGIHGEWQMDLTNLLAPDMGMEFTGTQTCNVEAAHDLKTGRLLSAKGQVELKVEARLPQTGKAKAAQGEVAPPPDLALTLKMGFEILPKPEKE
ncbi:MAG: hypothetical protein COZ06_12245 [Armatimonadetes bacterium CG_4_10_14_3_um_filter_66_18]|nr:hypothetical protein [Armatimonadota bacterium]OIP04146.1 MAG: hypothetical protein AUJ96_13490 [Armatimonadetes bacterium CG2_30_66_41]PIU90147.1 MAG: hypothetical protein COS65_26115 [Armatimonadetes bacterium CG06_land_8_20_14_3_00_66_21]PIX37714.1 MAG: hypothetical protein COZ57_32950 [Armatimonadetes bacterium CG_4_8_14_3_um_filter_66_20]PIY49877.1 MAG: hypothetical protein COZ06_12245 [Armatimonadetes bacterium CG_4_10_14_3_um_filter_66_18]PIZ30892.1 MAG: hypothetical protein COY42_33